jgi:hypothetical protein
MCWTAFFTYWYLLNTAEYHTSKSSFNDAPFVRGIYHFHIQFCGQTDYCPCQAWPRWKRQHLVVAPWKGAFICSCVLPLPNEALLLLGWIVTYVASVAVFVSVFCVVWQQTKMYWGPCPHFSSRLFISVMADIRMTNQPVHIYKCVLFHNFSPTVLCSYLCIYCRVVRNPDVGNKEKRVKCTFVQALRLCTVRTAHWGSRGIALL